MTHTTWLAKAGVAFFLLSTSGCVSWGHTPAFPAGAVAPAPVVSTLAFACPGTPSSSFVVVDATHATPAAVEALDQEQARWRVPTLRDLALQHPEVEADSCAQLADKAQRSAEWTDVHAPPTLLQQARDAGARSILVPVVASEYTCLIDTVGQAGLQIRTGTSRCYESEVFLLMYLFSAQGQLLWRKQVRVTHGSYTLSEPARYERSAAELLADLPVVATTAAVRR